MDDETPASRILGEPSYDPRAHYERICEKFRSHPLNTDEKAQQHGIDLLVRIFLSLKEHVHELPSEPILKALQDIVAILLVDADVYVDPPSPYEFIVDQEWYLDNLEKGYDASRVDPATNTLEDAFRVLFLNFPSAAYQRDTNAARVPLIQVYTNAKSTLTYVLGALTSAEAPDGSLLFGKLAHAYLENLASISNSTIEKFNFEKAVHPKDSDLSSADLAQAYLKGTPFLDLFMTPVPFHIPEKLRHDGQWVIAPPGSGKTQLLQAQIAADLERVVRGEASIVVMESTRDLINNIAQLKIFGPGQPLHGKLILIEPEPDHPLALNIFDIGIGANDPTISARDREALFNSGMELLELVINSMLGAELTKKQTTPFRHVLNALVLIPDATINTLRDFMEPGGYQRYKAQLGSLDPNSIRFFETQYDKSGLTSTRDEVIWRLDFLATQKTFMRMFSAPRSKFSFYDELNSSKVILINTDIDLLKRQQTEAFGRFFLAMLMQAVERRSRLPREQRRTIACYIDECQDYISDDSSITTLLDKGRKHGLALVLAHQRIDQLSDDVKSAISNVGIRYCAAPNPSDARFLSSALHTTPDFLAEQQNLQFAVWVRGVTTNGAISIKVPFLVIENMPKMTEADQFAIRSEMHRRYSYDPKQTSPRALNTRTEPASFPPQPMAPAETSSPAPSKKSNPQGPSSATHKAADQNAQESEPPADGAPDPGEPSSDWKP